MKKIIITLTIVIVVLLGVGFAFVVLTKKDNDGTGTTSKLETSNNFTNKEIEQIQINIMNIKALGKDKKVYAIGEEDTIQTFGLSEEKDKLDVPTVIAENVEKNYASGYIDSNNDLYLVGVKLEGGVRKKFEKIYSNVRDFYTMNMLANMLVTENGEAYIANSSFNNSGYGGFTTESTQYTKIADNVKSGIVEEDYSGYITQNDEFYIKLKDTTGYKKVLDNVSKVVGNSMDASYDSVYVLRKDGALYRIKNRVATKIFDNIKDIKDIMGSTVCYLISNDGKIYLPREKTTVNRNTTFIDLETEDEYGILKFKNVKEILYMTINKIIYLDNNNKVVLYNGIEEKTVEYTIDSLADIMNFVKN